MKATDKGLLKTFSKMGISTLQSYQGAQIFEAIGLNRELVDRYFTGTASRIEGVGMEVLAREALMKHEYAMETMHSSDTELRVGGEYQYRVRGERHLLNPTTVSKLQHAVRQSSFETFEEFAKIVDQQNRDNFHAARHDGFQARGDPVPHRRCRARFGNREALCDRRDVFRLHQQGSARDAGHRHEPDAAASRIPAKAARTKRVSSRTRMAICAAAPSSRWLRRVSA